MEEKIVQVVVLGAGFGGLTFCQHFKNRKARVTLVDRTNHHLFQPLLYQVATAGLSATEVAQPIRSILSDREDVTVFLDEVLQVSLLKREVVLQSKTLTYDYLVLALGGCNHYFGHPEWEQFAPGLKTLGDAVRIRSRVLLAFEKAENTDADVEHMRLMTTIIIGGGPTGVELAGAFAELARRVLLHDFRHINPAQANVILIEGGPRILSHLPESLSQSAVRQLEKLGVHVRTGAQVKNIRRGEVELANGEVLGAENILWAAGVSASPITQKLGVELDRAGRVKVNPDLSMAGHPEIFAIGDLAFVLQADGKPVPGVSPAAMQMARHVAKIIDHELSGLKFERAPFKYWDKGTMATIGRSKAVAQVGSLKMSGLLAWLAWLSLHLVFLIGFRNKVAVMLDWIYSYFAYKRGARIIMNESLDRVRETNERRSGGI
ncbi:MAG TPA: NAD(P)/FAD-dependent oxidoreductase [Candidatus Acidoferrales bacterium]|nr:NAD(P)/FAD-dependent oxidoreductase [Candidatus Acidoferrales bacterium]